MPDSSSFSHCDAEETPMAIREVPRSFVYQCDACGEEHVQENPTGHYTDSRPPQWTTLRFTTTDKLSELRRDEKLLCENCGTSVVNAIDRAIKLRSTTQEARPTVDVSLE